MKKWILFALLSILSSLLVTAVNGGGNTTALLQILGTASPVDTSTIAPVDTSTPMPANTPTFASTIPPADTPTSVPTVDQATSTPMVPSPTATFFFFPTGTPFFQPTSTPFDTPIITVTPAATDTATPTETPAVVVETPGVPPTPAQPALDPSILRAIKAGTIITLAPPAVTTQGGPFTLSGTLRDWSGGLVPNASIIFTLNGSYLGQTRTDNNGFFQQKFTKPLDAGIYAVTASFNGTHNLAYSSAAATLNIPPADVEVQTVPPIAGVTFQLNGKQFVTGDDGSASIKVDRAGTYRLEALISLYNDPTQKIEFGRWLEDNFQPFTEIQVPTNKVIAVGLNIYNLVGETFVDLDGLPVNPQRISQFTIRSEQGDTFVLNNGTPRWLPASRITRRVGGLVVTKLLYSVINVKLDGSNVVNESQQQFYAEPNDTWKISLLLYSLRIRVDDGLFGSPAGKSINLLYPNGQVNNYPLDPTGAVEIHGLARGNYTIQVAGARGLGNRMPVALSRNQDANIKVLTYTDLGIVGTLGIFVALALLLYGRRGILLSSLRKRQQTVRGANNALLRADDIRPAEGQRMAPKDELIKWS